MAGGDRFTASERYVLDEAIRKAEQLARVEFSVFVGHADGEARAFAGQLHSALVTPDRSILIMVDPDARVVEVVTGSWVRRNLTDSEVELAIAEMQSLFAEGDLVGGLRRGVHMLADHARAPETLHAERGMA